MWMLYSFIYSLITVFAIELPVGFMFGARSPRKLITVALANVITNPLVVLTHLCLSLFFPLWQNTVLFIPELFAVLAEGFMFSAFKTFNRKNPYFVSLVLNALSFITGEVINMFL